MCTRLKPDIIVAAEISSAISVLQNRDNNLYFNKDVSKSSSDDILISIKSCMEIQRSYAQSGLGNIFIGYEEKYWDFSDYKEYLNSHNCFERIDDNKYIFSLSNFLHLVNFDYNLNECSDNYYQQIKKCITEVLLTQSVYSSKILFALGL